MKGVVGDVDLFLIGSIVSAPKLYAGNVRARYVYQSARPQLAHFQLCLYLGLDDTVKDKPIEERNEKDDN